MTDRPIIFSAPMVRALVAGRKTQTRRLAWRFAPAPVRFDDPSAGMHPGLASPWQAIKPGDRLWVRECCRAVEHEDGLDGVRYAADEAWRPIENSDEAAAAWLGLFHYRGAGVDRMGASVPSIHMPRWASRLTLLVEAARVQRLQDITEADAQAEGMINLGGGDVADCWWHSHDGLARAGANARAAFGMLWDDLHGPDAWDANPWVVALTFSVQRRNIDALKEATHA